MAFWRTYYHLVWATKEWEALISAEVEGYLYPFLVSKAGELGLHVYAINGWTNHTHMVVSIPPKLSVSEAVGKLKGSSSRFIEYKMPNGQTFNWHRGYGVFTLGRQSLPLAIAYVERQKTHHQKQTTNQWLETLTDHDDGPKKPTQQTQLKEPTTPYQITPEITDPLPF